MKVFGDPLRLFSIRPLSFATDSPLASRMCWKRIKLFLQKQTSTCLLFTEKGKDIGGFPTKDQKRLFYSRRGIRIGVESFQVGAFASQTPRTKPILTNLERPHSSWFMAECAYISTFGSAGEC